MNVALMAAQVAVMNGGSYHRHRAAYGYGPAAAGKANVVGAAGTDPEEDEDVKAFFVMLGVVAAIVVGVSLTAIYK